MANQQEIFEDYLAYKNDLLEDKVSDLIKELTNSDDFTDIGVIYQVLNNVMDVLENNGYETCHPYFYSAEGTDEETPCYQAGECEMCILHKESCPFSE